MEETKESFYFNQTAPKSQKQKVILSLVMVLVLTILVGGFAGIKTFFPRAENGGCNPYNIEEQNLSSNSVEVVFQTQKACLTEINYGTSPESLPLKIPENMAVVNHKFTLSPLLPATTYYYVIRGEEKTLSQVRSFLTKSSQSGVSQEEVSPPVAVPTVLTPTALPSPTVTSGFSFEEFKKYYGSKNADYDFDKNGVVNTADWLYYKKQIEIQGR